jgi:hypothetical protein
MSARTKWLIAIIGLLVGNVLAMVTLAVAANVDKPQIDPTYFQSPK